MSDLETAFSLANLRRAYRWILSNPDAHYKGYFRDSYDAFAIASDTHLKWIRQEVLKERYQVSHASKVLLPKASGLLRPITLLTVEDQIVYQACVNIIAEALKKNTRHRYETRVFAHLYAGKSSNFFYIKWQRSYGKFSWRVRDAFDRGYRCVVNFDLASFYDSIDHHVLKHCLTETGIDEDLTVFLLDALRTWTSSTWSNGPKNIYHEHGIPQGPLASGMLSEAVLQHIDAAGEQGRKTIYLRYVDDIKILAKTETELRRKLIKLDITAKEIGLFPQTSKINIRTISNPDEEIKSVSRPPEPSIDIFPNQTLLETRLLELTRGKRLKPQNSTRFKYLLAHSKPSHRLNERLMRVLEHQPDAAPSITSYISRYKKLPAKLASQIMAYLEEPELYHHVNALLLRSALGRCSPQQSGYLGRFCADRLLRPKPGFLVPQPTYKEALLAWSISTQSISYAEFEKLVLEERDWWIKKASLRELTATPFGVATYADHLNKMARDSAGEVARMAAARLLQDSLGVAKPYGDIETTAKQMLKAAKVIRAVGQPASRINEILAYVLKRIPTDYDWKTFFGAEHAHAERMMIFLKRNRETNVDAFLVQLDSYCDLLFRHAYSRLKPGKVCPKYGAALRDPNLAAALPNAVPAFLALHAVRLQSTTAHPKDEKTNKATRRLKHRDFYKMRPAMVLAFDELEQKLQP